MNFKPKKICVVGLGYIGLPTAVVIAKTGIHTIGVDIDQRIVEAINSGNAHVSEPNLGNALNEALKKGFFKAFTVPTVADVFIIAVPTPLTAEEKKPDLSFVRSATKSICPHLKAGDLIILESTVPVGTTERMLSWISEERPDLQIPNNEGLLQDIFVAFCPERVLPGRIMDEIISNDRVIGGITRECAERARSLYRNFVSGECVIASHSRVAELTKLSENSFRDVNIAFANELSMICGELKVDIWEVLKLANRHPRVNMLNPGPGVGGHCIAVDPWFIVSSVPKSSRLMKKAREVNDMKPYWVIRKVTETIVKLKTQLGDPKINPKIAIYGITFKADVEDLRESPSLMIAEHLGLKYPDQVVVVDPFVQHQNKSFEYFDLMGYDQALSHAEIHLMLVDHSEFKCLPKPKGILIDTRGIW